MSEAIKVPRFDLVRIETRRDRLVAALRPFLGDVPKQETLYDIADVLALTCHLERRSTGLIETCRTLPNAPLSERSLFYFASRLAARHEDLVAGRPVRPWVCQSEPEWIAFEILEGEHGRDKKDQLGTAYWLQSLTGSVCPRVIQKFWTRKQCAYLARLLGFTHRNGHYPFQDAMQMVRLRFAGLVEPARSKDGPDFFQVATPGSFLAWNREILNARLRHDPACPNGYRHACHNCPVGYDACMAGTHPASFVLDWCGGCNEESCFDPAVDSDRCVTCRRAKKMRKKNEEANNTQPEVQIT